MAFNMSHGGAVQENPRYVNSSYIHADAAIIRHLLGFAFMEI